MNCKHCKNNILDGARVCTDCGSYQSNFFYYFNYFSSTGGFFGIIIASFTYIFVSFGDFYQELTWEESLAIHYYDSAANSLLKNTGDGDIFVSHANIYFQRDDKVSSFRHQIEKKISRNQVAVISQSGYMDQFGKEYFSDYLSEQRGDQSFSMLPRKDNCLWLVFRTVNHHENERLDAFYAQSGRQLSDVAGKMEVHYISLHKNLKLKSELPLRGVFIKNVLEQEVCS